MAEGERPIITDRRRFLRKAAGVAVGTLLGLGAAGAIKVGIESTNETLKRETSPESAAGYKVKLDNNKDVDYYSANGDPLIVESGTEFTTTVRTKDGEKKVGTGIKIITTTKTDGSKTLAFKVDTSVGEKEWLPIDPKLSPEPITNPFFSVVSKDQIVLTVYARHLLSPDGRDTFKLQPAKFNRSPVSNPVNKQP